MCNSEKTNLMKIYKKGQYLIHIPGRRYSIPHNKHGLPAYCQHFSFRSFPVIELGNHGSSLQLTNDLIQKIKQIVNANITLWNLFNSNLSFIQNIMVLTCSLSDRKPDSGIPSSTANAITKKNQTLGQCAKYFRKVNEMNNFAFCVSYILFLTF